MNDIFFYDIPIFIFIPYYDASSLIVVCDTIGTLFGIDISYFLTALCKFTVSISDDFFEFISGDNKL